jgi:hypothetical protein
MSPRVHEWASGPSAVRMGALAALTRTVVRTLAPELRIEKHWGLPWYVGNDLVLAIGEFTHHVGVEFWRGSTIADADRMLEGTGKNLRHVKLRTFAEARSDAFQRLVRAALELDRVGPERKR